MLFFLLLLKACHGRAFPLKYAGYSSCSFVSANSSQVHHNVTTQTVPWQEEPRSRGTFRLFMSCMITLSLCVWAAVHLNIPRQDMSAFQLYMRKTRWLMMGVFAPELVVYIAWRQYKSASHLTKSMNEVFEGAHQERKHSWTVVHSFYAGMGGFVIDTADPIGEPYTCQFPRLALGSRGLLFVARHGGYLPDVSKASIVDRSKADNVGKALVCLQAGWAIVQCISRLMSHLPLTLLEVNTLGHVLCAFLMYIFWLEKPLDVREPTTLTGTWTRPVCAWLLMNTSLNSGSKERSIEISGLYVYPRGIGETTLLTSSYPEPTPSSHEECKTEARPYAIPLGTETCDTVEEAPESMQPSLTDASVSCMTLQENEILSGTVFGPRPNTQPKQCGAGPKTHVPVSTVDLDLATINRWRLASNFISEHWDVLGVDPAKGLPEGPLTPDVIDSAKLIMPEVPDWPGLDHFSGDTISTCAKLCTVITSYGGLHAGAWNSSFPTNTEALLWKMSAVLVTGSGSIASMVAVIKYWKTQDKWKQNLRRYANRHLAMTPETESMISRWLSECTFCAYNLMVFSIVPTFVLARLYLVVEAFISLRRLPIEAYQTPAWTQWIPHL